jgi:hypothetical protein
MLKTFKHVTHGAVPLLPVGGARFKKVGVPLTNYTTPSKLEFPPVYALERPIAWGMLGNGPDTYNGQPFAGVGNCFECYMLHQIMAWSAVAHAGDNVSFTTEQAVDLYSAIMGYKFGDDSTDQGTDPDTGFSYWQNTGVYGHKILGKVTIDLGNLDLLKWAIFTFGGAGFGLSVPNYIMQAATSWSLPSGGDTTIDGEHQVGFVGFGRGGFRIDSWGTTYTFNPDFLAQFGLQATAVVSEDWVKKSGVAPSGLDLQGLLADLQQAV